MKLNYLFGAVAACGLLAGAAHAQSTTSAPTQDTTSGAAGSMTTPSPSNAAAGSTEGSTGASAGMSGSLGAGASSGTTSSGDTATSSTTDPSTGVSATSATSYGQGASVTVTTTTNGPVPDTAENRAKYGGPMSHAGRRSAAKGN